MGPLGRPMVPPPRPHVQRASPSGLLGGGPLEVPDLFDQVSLFIVELFVLRPVVLELAEKLDELGLVLQEDVQDGLRLVGVGHKHLMEGHHQYVKTQANVAASSHDLLYLYLKNVERFKLDVAALIPEQVHH